MRIPRVLVASVALLVAFQASADPLRQPSQPSSTIYTVDNTTGGTKIPTTPSKTRVGLTLTNTGATRAYCVETTATTCSVAASVTNYSLILEPAAGADQQGGAISRWMTNNVNYCCATTAGSTKVVVTEDVL